MTYTIHTVADAPTGEISRAIISPTAAPPTIARHERIISTRLVSDLPTTIERPLPWAVWVDRLAARVGKAADRIGEQLGGSGRDAIPRRP